MIAVDTNVLVYSHRPEMPFHERATELVRMLAEGDEPWMIPWPAIHEFLAVVTNPKIFQQPTSMSDALMQVSIWGSSPSALPVSENEGYFPILQSLLQQGAVVGPKVHDARIVAICIAHGASALYSADRDFSRFGSAIKIINPFIVPTV